MYVHMYVCMYVCIYVCTYVCMYVCMYVVMYIPQWIIIRRFPTAGDRKRGVGKARDTHTVIFI